MTALQVALLILFAPALLVAGYFVLCVMLGLLVGIAEVIEIRRKGRRGW